MIDWDQWVIGPTTTGPYGFGEPAVYHGRAVTQPITGVFDDAYYELTPLGRGEMTSEGVNYGLPGGITARQPSLGVRLSQFLPGVMPTQGDAVVVRATRYYIREVQPDGKGWARLLLSQG